MARVVLKQIQKLYPGGVAAVKSANLVIEDKEFIVLVGPSGCGKSTTLRMIAGLEEATAGEIFIGDRCVNEVAPKDRDIAMVFQNYALYPHMSVYKNLAFGLKLRKCPRKLIDQRVREAAEMLGITDLLPRQPKSLSGGQRQRVAVGRAIVRQPQVFLFDEPLSNLDARLRVQMRAELRKLHRRLQTTMVYVTHDQIEAMTMGDRIVVMLDGEIQQVDTPLNLYRHPVNRFVAEFIGSPPMNLIQGRLDASHNDLWFRDASGNLSLRVPAQRHNGLLPHAGRDCICGIRAEHFSLPSPVQQPEPGSGIRARVDMIEPLGSEVYLHLSLHQTPVMAQLQTDTVPPVGTTLVLGVDTSKLHFFEAAPNGVNLERAD